VSARPSPIPDLELAPALHAVYGAVPDDASVRKLRGDASTRTYYRLSAPSRDPRSLVIMHLPADFATRSDEASAGDRAPDLPFLDVQRLLEARGVPVPRVLAHDLAHRIVLLEDLGDETFEARLAARPRTEWMALYERAVDLLADLHERCARRDLSSVAYRRRFDLALLRWELDHFREWGLEALHGPLAAADRAELDRHFDALAERLSGAEVGFVHRDYQSRNLMWARPETAGGEALVVIDFQDALIGPRPYDLVALLCDSYVELDLPLQRAMLDRYVSNAGLERSDAIDFERTFWLQAVQRKLKDAGRFVFIDRVRHNPDFLPWYAPSLRYVTRALAQLGGLGGLDTLLARLIPGSPDHVSQPASCGPAARE